MFEDNFSNIVPEGGAFLTRYSRWGAYPNYFPVTNKRGFYKPNLLSVKDLGNGQTALGCPLVPGAKYSDGKSRSTAACPRFPGQNDGQHLSLRWEQRCRVVKKVAKWHAANLGWPIKDTEWPDKGENDYMEMQLDGYGGRNGEGPLMEHVTLQALSLMMRLEPSLRALAVTFFVLTYGFS